tara:strand:+ start:322 stop:678 length:357 start_codon:yes stop_codon:yes gene_type:complete
MNKTLVLGASNNPDRISNQVMLKLKQKGIPVVAVGNREGVAHGIEITKEFPTSDIDTVTLYLGAKNQFSYYDKIIALKPKRIIFNPGAENPELSEIAGKNSIVPLNACTLVMLSIGNY